MSAEDFKKLGNEAFSKGDNDTAIAHFTKAIELDGNNHVLFSNRSAAHAAKGDYSAALADADRAVALKPDWSRAHGRRATALHFLGRLSEAHSAYGRAIELDPTNAQLQEARRQLEQEARRAFDPSRVFAGDVIARLAADPATAAFCQDPSFVAIIESLKKDPNEIQKYAKDKRVLTALTVLIGGGSASSTQKKPPPPAAAAAAAAAAAPATPEETKKKEPEPEPMKTDDAMPGEQKLAEKEKELGNTAYKEGKFEEAIAHYQKATDLFPDDATYRSNLSAAYLEAGNAAKCIEECTKAVEDARRLRQYKLLPKLLTRMGNAHSKLEQWTEAISCYQRSLTENRNADTLARLQKAEKAKKLADERAYLNPELSRTEKERGNEHFKNGMFPEAIAAYTEAIKRCPTDHVLYSNRSAAYMKLGEYPTALRDAEKCIEMAPNFVKGHTRKAACHFYMKEYHKAIASYDHGLKLEPGNQECIEGMARVEATISAQQSSSEADQEQLKHAMADPEIRAILQDPVMQQVIQDLTSNPQSSQHHLRNPDIMARLQKLAAAGVIRLG